MRSFLFALCLAATPALGSGIQKNAVAAPTTATDDALARYDGTTGKVVQNSAATLTDPGVLTLKGTVGGPQPQFALTEDPDNGTDTVKLQAVASLSAPYTLTWPPDDGTSGQLLRTDGSGVLTWVTPAGPSIGDAITGGTTGSLLFIGAAAALAQDNANLFWDDTNNRLGLGTTTPLHLLDLGATAGSGLADVAAKKLAVYESGGTQFYGLGVSTIFSGSLLFYAGAASTDYPKMVLAYNGYLGLNKPNNGGPDIAPNSQLDVGGTTAAGTPGTEKLIQMTRFSHASVSYPQVATLSLGTWDTNGAGNGYGPASRMDVNLKSVADGDETATTAVASFLSNGRVGINMTAPAYTLDVTGDTHVSGKLIVDETGGNGGNVPHVRTRRSSTTNTSATCSVTCDGGDGGGGIVETAMGGGCQNSLALNMSDSYPSANDVWSCEYSLATGNCTAWAICFQY